MILSTFFRTLEGGRMTERVVGSEPKVETGLGHNLNRINQDLAIMDRHAEELAAVEQFENESFRRWDREYKDAHLHSIPKPRKHNR